MPTEKLTHFLVSSPSCKSVHSATRVFAALWVTPLPQIIHNIQLFVALQELQFQLKPYHVTYGKYEGET